MQLQASTFQTRWIMSAASSIHVVEAAYGKYGILYHHRLHYQVAISGVSALYDHSRSMIIIRVYFCNDEQHGLTSVN